MPGSVAAADEYRHAADSASLWGEAWYFDFAAADCSLGGFVRLGLYPNLGVAWYWAYLVGPDRPLIAVRDHEIELPRTRALEVRSDGLWSALNCETPLDHWSVGLEAFAVAMDDPMDAYRGELGDRIALGFDLEWEAESEPRRRPDGGAVSNGYGQPCLVHGALLVGTESIDPDAGGYRSHSWGIHDWWATPWSWMAGRMSDGDWVEGEVGTDWNADGLPTSARGELDGLSLSIAPVALAPIPLEGPGGRRSHLPRALCRLEDADHRSGAGWGAWLRLVR